MKYIGCLCSGCQQKQYRYSKELQKTNYRFLLLVRKCCLFCIAFILGTGIIFGSYIRSRVGCLYNDTGSEDLGVPNFYLSCGASKEDCQYYGYEYHSSQDSAQCCPREEVHLCVYPKHSSPPKPTAANQFQILSWNVYQRPLYLSQAGQVERTCHIPAWIADNVPNTDVVVFMESYSDGCWGDRSSMKEMLKSHGYLHSTKPVEASMHLHTAGIFLASKWPIEHQDPLIFGLVNVKTLNKYHIPKGAVYAKIRKTVGDQEQTYHVVALHFFANRDRFDVAVRLDQAKQLEKFLSHQNIPQSEPVILAGDFNLDYYTQNGEREEIMKILSGAMPRNISELPYTFDRISNKLNKATNTPDWPLEWLDYVVYKSNHKTPKDATLDSFPARTEKPMYFCMCPNCANLGMHRIPKHPDCDTIRNHTDLSDHYPVIATFTF